MVKFASFLNLITAVFIGLKLSNAITWGWLQVLSPTLFLIGIILFALLIMFVTVICIFTYDYVKGNDIDG